MNTVSRYFVIMLATIVAGVMVAYNQAGMASTPAQVVFKSPALYPEGVAWDAAHHRFLVSSIHTGVVGAVTETGAYSLFARDPHMVSSVGVQIDAARDRVLVCNADPGASVFSSKKTKGKLAGLAAFRLSTGKLIKYINLAAGISGSHFCNDLTIDKDGTAYITDSFSPIVYKVDKHYHASVLIDDKTFVTGPSFNLNGIVVKDDYLLVLKMNSGQIFRIPLANPKRFKEVRLTRRLYGADGALWAADGSLIVIAGNNADVGAKPAVATNKVFKLRSNDNWASARIVGVENTGEVFPTTGTIMDGNIYVNQAMLQVLFNPKTKKQVEQFDIKRYRP